MSMHTERCSHRQESKKIAYATCQPEPHPEPYHRHTSTDKKQPLLATCGITEYIWPSVLVDNKYSTEQGHRISNRCCCPRRRTSECFSGGRLTLLFSVSRSKPKCTLGSMLAPIWGSFQNMFTNTTCTGHVWHVCTMYFCCDMWKQLPFSTQDRKLQMSGGEWVRWAVWWGQ